MKGRYKLATVILFVVTILLSFLYSSSLMKNQPRTKSASPAKLQGNISQQAGRMLAKDGNYEMSLPRARCHWLRPTHNGTPMLLEIITYNNSEACGGQVVQRRQLVLNKPLSIHGKCLCGTSCQFQAETVNSTTYLEQQGVSRSNASG